MARVIKRHIFKDGKAMYEDRIAYANGEFISLDDFDTEIQSRNNEIARLNNSLEEIDSYYCEYKKQAQEKISELESELEVKDNLLKIKNGLFGNNDELPTDPIEVAQMLINATYERQNCMTGKVYDKDIYDIDDLEQIAEHLLVYCKHHREE